MNFHEIRFPAALSFGSSGGPERRTEIITLSNGFEERNTPWSQSRRRYDAGVGMRSLDDLDILIGFFEARQGQLFGFRWKDWTDFKSCKPSAIPDPTDQVIGAGDGTRTTFQLSKTYRSGEASYLRLVRKPVSSSVRLALSGDELEAGQHFSIEPGSGMVTFVFPPPLGSVVSAGFEFDVPVRFDTDRILASANGFNAGEVPAVPVVEVRV